MNGISTTTNAAAVKQNTEWCLGAKMNTEAKNDLPEMGRVNFNLQPYKFTAPLKAKSEMSEDLKLNRLQAFGNSFSSMY